MNARIAQININRSPVNVLGSLEVVEILPVTGEMTLVFDAKDASELASLRMACSEVVVIARDKYDELMSAVVNKTIMSE